MPRLPLIVVSIALGVSSLPLAAEPPVVRLSDPVAVEAGADPVEIQPARGDRPDG